MANPTSNPDLIAAAAVQVLTGVGTLGAVLHRTPADPYQGPAPLLMVNPVQEQGGWHGGRAKRAVGWLQLTYYAERPEQQDRELSLIENDLWTDRQAILDALEANRSLNGAAVSVADEWHGDYIPGGTFVDWQGGSWVSMTLRVSWSGGKFNV